MRPCAAPLASSPEETLSDTLAAYELAEVSARAYLRIPAQFREGMAAGRLRTGGRFGLRLVHRRLVFRHPRGRRPWGDIITNYVTLQCPQTGEVVRLAYA